MKSFKSSFLILVILMCFGFLSALIAHAYIGFFSRYWFDDFCTAAILRDEGFFGSQKFWYLNWSGRFSFLTLVNIAELIGPAAVSYLPAVSLLLWLTVSTWATYEVLLFFRSACPGATSLLVGPAIVFLTIHSTPDVVQSLYWQTGMLTYLIPIIFLTAYAGFFFVVLRKQPRARVLLPLSIFGALLTFFAGGFSESFSIFQVVIFIMLVFACFRLSVRRSGLALAAAGFLGAVLALSIVAIAPGNKNRLATLPPAPPVFSLFRSAAGYTLYFIEQHTRRSRSTALLSLFLPVWVLFSVRFSRRQEKMLESDSQTPLKRRLKAVVFTIIFAYLLLITCFMPGFLVVGGLPLRAWILPKFVLIVAMLCGGFLLAPALVNTLTVTLKQRSRLLFALSVLAAMIITIVPVQSMRRTLELRAVASESASRWDKSDQELRQARLKGKTEFDLPKINVNNWRLGFGRIDLQPSADPKDPQNRCIAKYYLMDSVRAE